MDVVLESFTVIIGSVNNYYVFECLTDSICSLEVNEIPTHRQHGLAINGCPNLSVSLHCDNETKGVFFVCVCVCTVS